MGPRQSFRALTEFGKSIYVRAGLDASRIIVKPNFAPDPGQRAEPPSGSQNVLFVGRVESEKGVDVLLDAWKRSALRGLRLQIIGDGPLRRPLQREYPDVDFLGWVDSNVVRRKMLEGRALVFPSRSFEGQSMVILEAMAAGLPVMASDWPPIRETTRTHSADWIREPGDTDSWAKVSRPSRMTRLSTPKGWRRATHTMLHTHRLRRCETWNRSIGL